MESESSDEDPFADNSDDDPTFTPSEGNDLNHHHSKSNLKRKIKIIEKTSKMRKRNVSEWVDVKSKKLLNLGLEHENRKGKTIVQRKMAEACKRGCRLKCYENIAEDARKSCFTEFWNLGDHTRQWDYIVRFVRQKEKKQVTVSNAKKSRRQYSREYFLKARDVERRVCKVMFLNTLGISETWVTTALSKVLSSGTIPSDLRGRHNNRSNVISASVKDSVRNHINLFPKVPAHYTRKDSQKMYLEEGLSIQKMFRLYTEFCIQNNIQQHATLRQYRDIFNEEFNISFFKPKKDQCDVCSVYNLADDSKKVELQESYEKHLRNKTVVRNLKDIDKENAIKDKTLCVCCFDLQKVLPSPQSNVSDFYYKSKYSTYNFTVYDIGNKDGYCYVWHERIAKRGANEVASCLWKFLNAQKRKCVTKVILYSDNCSGQNRNKFIFSMLSYASSFLKMEIVHRFLEKGHTQNEGDSMHAVIECAKKRQPVIYMPEQWITLIRMAKKTGKIYNVIEMSQVDFLNFKKLAEAESWNTDTENKPFKVSQIRDVKFLPTESEKVYFKYDYEDSEYKILQKIGKRKGRPSKSLNSLEQLYKSYLDIDKKKLKGILWLCHTGKVPTMYHNFYESLKIQNTDLEDARNVETDTEDEED